MPQYIGDADGSCSSRSSSSAWRNQRVRDSRSVPVTADPHAAGAAWLLCCSAGCLAGCASSGAVPRPFRFRETGPRSPPGPVRGDTVAGDGLHSGDSLPRGRRRPVRFDCSGLCSTSSRAGVVVPGASPSSSGSVAMWIVDRLEPGDLVFFRITRETCRTSGLRWAAGGSARPERAGHRSCVDLAAPVLGEAVCRGAPRGRRLTADGSSAQAARCSPVRTSRRDVSARNCRTYRSSLV